MVGLLQWNTVVLYPAGFYVSRITITPTITLPEGWECSRRVGRGQTAAERRFISKPTTLEILVDSRAVRGTVISEA